MRFEIAGNTNIKSEYRIASLILDPIESIYLARFIFLPVIDGPDGRPIDLPTSQALMYLNQTINDNDFEFSLEIDGIRTSFTGVPSSHGIHGPPEKFSKLFWSWTSRFWSVDP